MFSNRLRSSSKIDFFASNDLTMSDGSTSLMSINFGRAENDGVVGAGAGGGSGGGDNEADEPGDRDDDDELDDEIDVFGDGSCGVVVSLLHVSLVMVSSALLRHRSNISTGGRAFEPNALADGLDAIVSESLDVVRFGCGFDGLSGCCCGGGGCFTDGGFDFAGCDSVNESFMRERERERFRRKCINN